MTTTLRRRAVLAGATLGLAGLLAACGSSSSKAADTPATTAATSGSTATAKAPTATGVWARTSAAMQSAGAAYMVLENTTDTEDALVKASVDASVAKTVEIHETVAADSGMTGTTMAGGMSSTTMAGGMSSTTMAGGMSSTTMAGGMGGAMKMQPVDKIVVPAKGKVELKPGGYHIMLLDLAKPLVMGESFDITLTFASGATSTVKAEVKDQA